VSKGVKLDQETRRWDDDRGETTLMRIKESAHDYRYFPDPDLLPVRTAKLVESAKVGMPELPQAKRDRFVADFGISEYDASVLADDAALADYFEKAAQGSPKPKSVANWIINDLLSALSAASLDLSECPIQGAYIGELTALIEGGTISGRQGKEVFAEMMVSGKQPAVIVEEKGLKQVSDTGAIEAFCDEVIAANPASVADYKSGKEAALNFLKGQVMKLSKGKANPAVAGEILAKKLQA
jgi:aspartyl-tRNA(Asn)/glutamyl-tRNA(Gln) amidotransferase subunit B